MRGLLSTSKTRYMAEYTMTTVFWAEKALLGTHCLCCRLGLSSVWPTLRSAAYTLATIKRVVEESVDIVILLWAIVSEYKV
jgi:hypothetical protein